ncbi:MAG: hypothetical protein ABW063_07125, partial [Caulobacter sp.]
MADDMTSPAEAAVEPQALARLLQVLDAGGYRFVTPGGAVIKANRRRRGDAPRDLRDIFGWSLPFSRADLAPHLFDLALKSGVLAPNEERWRSKVRVSSVEGRLF